MKRALLSLALLAAFAAPALAAGPIAKVNGKPIPAARAEALVANQVAQGRPDSPELRQAVREELIRREAITQAALAKGVEKRADVQAHLELVRQGVLIQAYINDYAAAIKIDDAETRKEYETIKSALGSHEYKARHILVDGEGEAKDIIEKLKKGEKFEELAKVSKDPGSRARGGELDWSVPDNYVPPFAQALVKLSKGQTTEAPVRSDFGWHVIRLDDRRALTPPTYEEVKPQLDQGIRQRKLEQHILDLRNKAKVE